MSSRHAALIAVLVCVAALRAVSAVAPMSAASTPKTAPYVAVAALTSGGGNRLDVIVRVRTALPRIACTATAKQAGRAARLPRLRTGAEGGAQWHWYVGDGAPQAKLKIRVRCRFPNSKVRKRTIAPLVGPGPFPRRTFRELIKRGNVLKEAWVPEKQHDGSGGDAELYPAGQCTSYVAKLRPDLPYFEGTSGDARNWIESAQANNLPTGTVPRVGAVAVFKPGQYGAGSYGHVAYVIAVEGDTMTVTEANFHSRPAGAQRKVPWQGVRFIYRQEKPPPPPSFPTRLHETFTIQCTSTGQSCLPVLSRRLHHDGGGIRVRFVAHASCSSIKVAVRIVGWDEAISPPLTDAMTFNPVFPVLPIGDYTVQLQGEGITGGCNSGSLISWGGELAIVTSVR